MWKIGKVITIHKQSDQQICENYKGITVLDISSKILSAITQRQLAEATEMY